MNLILKKYFIKTQIDIRYPDSFLIEILQYKLTTKLCSLKGFVLDGFPKNYD